jgi:hypothetical protein
MHNTIHLDSVIAISQDQVSYELGGEAAILDVKSGSYHGLDSLGARIWDLIQKPKAVREVLEVLLEDYEVETDRCENDLLWKLQSAVLGLQSNEI